MTAFLGSSASSNSYIPFITFPQASGREDEDRGLVIKGKEEGRSLLPGLRGPPCSQPPAEHSTHELRTKQLGSSLRRSLGLERGLCNQTWGAIEGQRQPGCPCAAEVPEPLPTYSPQVPQKVGPYHSKGRTLSSLILQMGKLRRREI